MAQSNQIFSEKQEGGRKFSTKWKSRLGPDWETELKHSNLSAFLFSWKKYNLFT